MGDHQAKKGVHRPLKPAEDTFHLRKALWTKHLAEGCLS